MEYDQPLRPIRDHVALQRTIFACGANANPAVPFLPDAYHGSDPMAWRNRGDDDVGNTQSLPVRAGSAATCTATLLEIQTDLSPRKRRQGRGHKTRGNNPRRGGLLAKSARNMTLTTVTIPWFLIKKVCSRIPRISRFRANTYLLE